MELYCCNGMKHTWIYTGREIKHWVSNTTSNTLPQGALITKEQKCSVCGLVRHLTTAYK